MKILNTSRLIFLLCMLAVQGFSQPPDNLHLNPSSGGGASGFFDATMRYPSGPGNGDFVLISIGGWTPGCVFMVRPNDNVMYILQDDASSWGSGAVLGTAVTLQNSVCSGWVGGSGKEVWHQSDGWYERGYVTITFKPGFIGSNPGWTGLYAYSGASNSTSGWVTTGTWTVPNITTINDSFVTQIYHAPSEAALDGYTGQQGLLPTTAYPAAHVTISSNSNILHYGDIFNIYVRGGKPNTQVWGRQVSFEPFSHNPDGTTTTLYFKPNAQASIADNVILPSDQRFNGGWLLGTTDSTGYFVLPLQVAPFEGNSIHIYVGNNSGTYVASLPDAQAIGAANYCAQDQFGTPISQSCVAQ